MPNLEHLVKVEYFAGRGHNFWKQINLTIELNIDLFLNFKFPFRLYLFSGL